MATTIPTYKELMDTVTRGKHEKPADERWIAWVQLGSYELAGAQDDFTKESILKCILIRTHAALQELEKKYADKPCAI